MNTLEPTITRIERFATKYKKSSSGCWEWISPCSNGYGRFLHHNAHRFSYQLTGNRLVKGMVIDHLCRNRKCVNPKHLEQVTQSENTKRGNTGNHSKYLGPGIREYDKNISCRNGHSWGERNTYIFINKSGSSQKMCRTCNNISHRKRYLANK